jgi:hypothetical protein
MPRARGTQEVQVSPETHHNIRIAAARQGVTLGKMVERMARYYAKQRGLTWEKPPIGGTEDEDDEEEQAA